MQRHPQVLIVDYGSQVATLIARTLRELGYRSVVLSPKRSQQWLQRHTPKALILSGGDASVNDVGAPQLSAAFLNAGAPVLGICYGMQLLAKTLGGTVAHDSELAEYGERTLTCLDARHDSPLLTHVPKSSRVWMSHGDSVIGVPDNFVVRAITNSSSSRVCVAIMEHVDRPIFGVQFHPEVVETEAGRVILTNFLSLSSCEKDWKPRQLASRIRQGVVREVGESRVILGYSGGVDSSVVAKLLAPVLRKQLLGVVIDTGFLRHGELREIRANARACDIDITVIHAKKVFCRALDGLRDAEEKRLAFRATYQRILQREAERFGAAYLVQGTLASDLIESASKGKSKRIKTHHNTGLIFQGIRQIHPLSDLFKYEVRALGAELGLPSDITEREPFPGPGLSVRLVGLACSYENIATLKSADATVRRILKEHTLLKDVSQLVVALIGSQTTAVKGDARVYGNAIVVRPFQSQDFMTGRGFVPPTEVIMEITRAVTALPGIVRCWWDFTEKPPATTEME